MTHVVSAKDGERTSKHPEGLENLDTSTEICMGGRIILVVPYADPSMLLYDML